MTAPGAPGGYTEPAGYAGSTDHVAGAGFDSGPPDVHGRSFGDLMGEVTRDLSTLVRQEVELAKAELREEGSKAGKAAGMFGAAGVAGFLVLLFLSHALWWGLSNVMDQGWAALIVAIIWAVIGAVLYSRARTQMKNVRGLPRTTETVKQVPDALKPDRGGI
ncbi:phage holin family protein [Plantactinospora siamensis]|uniref:Phage holin family protein n=1 Tax=Plantactinospora siamensis TaxID=555372 RepID=A0ABV6P2N5_9ACTN